MMGDLIPLSDEQAKAVQETAKAAVAAIHLTKEFGKFLGEMFGSLPKDIVGLLFGDYLAHDVC